MAEPNKQAGDNCCQCKLLYCAAVCCTILMFAAGISVLSIASFRHKFVWSLPVQNIDALRAVTIFLYVFGILLVAVTLFGLCAVANTHSFTIRLYCLFLLISFIAASGAGIADYIEFKKEIKDLPNELSVWVNEYWLSDSAMQKMDGIHRSFACCGIHSYFDYGSKIPLTCENENHQMYMIGCLDSVTQRMNHLMLLTGITLLVLDVLIAVTLIVNFFHSTRGEKEAI